MSTSDVTVRPTSHRFVWHRWPALLGLLAAAVGLFVGTDADLPAISVSIAACCYLGAAALDRPWMSWAMVPGGTALVVVTSLLGLPWWSGLGVVAAVLVVIGLLGVARRPALLAQAAALVGFGGVALAATILLTPAVGLVLAAVALATHAVWDVIHYRRRWVVPRSLAEFCIFLDVPLGVGLLVLAWAG